MLGYAGGVRAGHRLKFWTPGGSSTPLLTDEHLDVPLDYEGVGAVGVTSGASTPFTIGMKSSMPQRRLL